jgi:hypothetical protein
MNLSGEDSILYSKIEEFIHSYSNNELNLSHIKDELSIFKNITQIENDYNKIKNRSMELSYILPSYIELDINEEPIKQESINEEPIIKHHIKIDDTFNLHHDIEKYLAILKHAEKEIHYIIEHYIAIKEAKKYNIEIFKNIKCKKDGSLFNGSKLYEGRVIDIISNKGEPYLIVKEKNKNISYQSPI